MKQKMRGAKASYKKIDVPGILDLVGESITNFVSQSANQNRATVALEDISGNISG
jgi:hydroxyethylthiazole kinase-like sugar kinase family protein